MLPLQGVALLASALLLNLHYPLFGRPLLEGPTTSRPVLSAFNFLAGRVLIPRIMAKEGVPRPDRTEAYSGRCKVDIYEPVSGEGDQLRPAVLYFHSGGFIAGHRSMGGGMCGWLASHGAVGLSASYRLTNSGAGVAGCIEDAWSLLRWTRANAARLRIDPSRIVVAGDSAGGLLATALATGLGGAVPTGLGGQAPIDPAMLPAAVVASWPVTSLGSRSYAPRKAPDGAWESTPAAESFRVENVFVPSGKYGHSAEATQARLRTVLAGGLLCFGRRLHGLLPAGPRYPVDDAASVSPLRAAHRENLPPMLLLTAEADPVVPCEQTSRFAEVARRSGNEVAQIIFEEADHGGGGVNSEIGRKATLDFLRHHNLLQGAPHDEDDPRDAIGGTMRAFGMQPRQYAPLDFRAAVHGRSTLRARLVK